MAETSSSSSTFAPDILYIILSTYVVIARAYKVQYSSEASEATYLFASLHSKCEALYDPLLYDPRL